MFPKKVLMCMVEESNEVTACRLNDPALVPVGEEDTISPRSRPDQFRSEANF
jgi:hypothetical protein